tara:strand:- start:409 stop:642 length:234 start_codon:yes stop_codon:yes gene_type:complete
MERLDSILEQLSDNIISVSEAKNQVLVLLGVSLRDLDELKIEWLINDTYQVIDECGTTIHQGTMRECNDYLSGYYGG